MEGASSPTPPQERHVGAGTVDTNHKNPEDTSSGGIKEDLDLQPPSAVEQSLDASKLDIISSLPSDCASMILSRLSIPDMACASRVCTMWRDSCNDPFIWEEKCRSLGDAVSLDVHGAGRSLGIDIDRCVAPYDWKKLCQELYSFFGLFQTPLSLLHTADAVSTVDLSDARQELRQTLTDSSSFWSSTGSETPDKDEWGVYSLIHPACIILSLEIRPFQASFQKGMPVYAPRDVKASFDLVGNAEKDPSEWKYRSELSHIENTPELQSIPLGNNIIIGGNLRLDMFGRYEVQPNDNLFYTVLQYVRCLGIPLTLLRRKREVAPALLSYVEKYAQVGGLDLEQSDDALVVEKLEKENIRQRKIEALKQFIRDGKIFDAVQLIENSDKFWKDLRGKEMLKFWEECGKLRAYIASQMERGTRLNKQETLQYAKICIQLHRQTEFRHSLLSNRLSFSEELGDLLSTDPASVMNRMHTVAYINGGIPDKAIDTLMQSGDFRALVAYIGSIFYDPDWRELLKKFASLRPRSEAMEFGLHVIQHQIYEANLVVEALGIEMPPPDVEWDERVILRKELERLRGDEADE